MVATGVKLEAKAVGPVRGTFTICYFFSARNEVFDMSALQNCQISLQSASIQLPCWVAILNFRFLGRAK